MTALTRAAEFNCPQCIRSSAPRTSTMTERCVGVDYAPCDRTPSAASRASRATCQYECQRGMSEPGAACSSGSNPMARVITRATVSTSPFLGSYL